MGRTNGKLVSFLKEGLRLRKYINLTADAVEKIIYVYLPRYEKFMDPEYERLLKDWFACNNRIYVNYSNGKAVLKAAMKKSPYLMFVGIENKKMKYRFSSPQEIIAKRMQPKHAVLHVEVGNNDISEEEMPPSVASSGYASGHEALDSSPKPFETYDKLENSGNSELVNNPLLPNTMGGVFMNDEFKITCVPPYENKEINTANYLEERKSSDEEKASVLDAENFYELFVNLQEVSFGACDSSSLPVDSPLYADQLSANETAGLNFNITDEHDIFCKNLTNDDIDFFDSPEIPVESGAMTPDQSVHTGLNLPKNSLEKNSHVLESSPVEMLAEEQKFWICCDKKYFGSTIQYICEPFSLEGCKSEKLFNIVSINEDGKTTSNVFIESTHWVPNRIMKHHMVYDEKYLLMFYE